MNEPLFESATGAARMLRCGEISSRELTELLLARIDAVNPALNAVVELRREAALRSAAEADEAIARGDRLRPLHGVPITVKEAFNVKGMHTTWGNPAFKDFVAETDATVVQRLERAGAIIVGKTNVAFMLADFGQTANEVYGVTSNPWEIGRTPGGSSGGAAAALAAGMTFLDYGTDLVGSIRIPASFCGVYGLKPSVESVPLTGFQPPGPPAPPCDMTYMTSVGPLGRSARDLRTVFNVTAGPERPAGKAYSWALAPPRHDRLEDFRVGVVFDHERAPVSSEITARLSNVVDTLTKAGVTVVEGWPDGVDPGRSYESFGFQVGMFLAFAEAAAAAAAAAAAEAAAAEAAPAGSGPTGSGGAAELSEFIEHETRRMLTRAAWGRYFDEFDVFLCPANFTPAFPHDTRPFPDRTIMTPEGERSYQDQAFWVSVPSLPGLPAVAAPIGNTPGGLPIGVQIVGPLHEDDTALTFAELLGETIGGYQPPER